MQLIPPADGSADTAQGSAVTVLEPAPLLAVADAASPPPPLQGMAIDKDWSALSGAVSGIAMPPDASALIKYLSEGYFPAETELSIDEAITLALANNHGLNSKRLSAVAACQGIEINWADLRPQLGVQGKTYWQRINGKGGDNSMISSLALSLTQRIYDFGLTNNLINISRAQYSIANYSVSMAEQQLVSDVITSYYQFSMALGQVRIRRDELLLSQEFLRQTQIQFRVGTVPKLDVIRAEARVQTAQDSFISALSTTGDAAAHFYSLLGVEDKRYVPAVITADLINMGGDPPAVEAAADLAISTRPEIQLQYAALAAGEGKIKLTKNRPMLQAYANAQYREPAAQSGTDAYEYGLQLMWNIYTGGKDQLEKKQAQTQLNAIGEDIYQLESQVELDATTAWNRLFTARASVVTALKNMELSAEALHAAAVGYSAGVTPYIDFQNAFDGNIAANLAYLGALIEVKLAQVNLERAQGFPRGYPGDTRAGMKGDWTTQALLDMLPAAPPATEPGPAADAAVPAPAAQ